MTTDRVLVAIPAYNEAATIGQVVAGIRDHLPQVDLLVVDDGSRDATREVLAITRLDGKAVGDGRPGPLFRRMHGLFQQFKEQVKREPQRQVHA